MMDSKPIGQEIFQFMILQRTNTTFTFITAKNAHTIINVNGSLPAMQVQFRFHIKLQKAHSCSAEQEFLSSYVTQTCITAFTEAYCCSLTSQQKHPQIDLNIIFRSVSDSLY